MKKEVKMSSIASCFEAHASGRSSRWRISAWKDCQPGLSLHRECHQIQTSLLSWEGWNGRCRGGKHSDGESKIVQNDELAATPKTRRPLSEQKEMERAGAAA